MPASPGSAQVLHAPDRPPNAILAPRMKQRLKSMVGEGARRRLRRLGRLRWATKTRVLRRHDVGLLSRPGTWLRYVLLDPEVDSFTYPLSNVDELVALLAEQTDLPAADLAAFAAEPPTDPELTTELRRRLRWRLDQKAQLHPVGHHLAAWILIRARRPGLVVEAGVLDGLASLVMLRALERNAQEGAPGRLVSFDVMPGAGSLVSPRLRQGWELTIEDSRTAVASAVGDTPIDLFLSDSLPDSAHVRAELDAVLERAAPVLDVIQVWGGLDALHDVGRELGVPVRLFQERPDGHFYPGNRIALARLRGAGSGSRSA